MKKTLLGLAAVVLILAATAGSLLLYLRSSEPPRAGEARLPGLEAPVEVLRDSLGIPEVRAASEADLMRAMGYLHAQERLWQMELFRRVADGRLSEVLGAAALQSDRFLRTLGMGRAAARSMPHLDAEHLALLQAYAEGVNAWIGSRSGALPPEFVALRFRPEPWEPRHSMAVARLVAWDLADWNLGLDVQRVLERAGPEAAELVYPGYPAWGPSIVGGDPAPGTQPVPRPRLAPAAARIPEIPPLAAALLSAASASRASNSWVVAGSRTRSGRPILANDPHLGLTAPSIWFPAVLRGGGIEVAGVTIPGIPWAIIGRTPGVAWGFTNAMVDDSDFVEERLHPGDSLRYQVPGGGWERMEVREETIQVRGADPVVHRVRGTRNGPLISDVDRRASRPLALRWTGLHPSTAVRAPRAMNRARNAAEMRAALRLFDDPHQIGIYADTTGEIGFRMVGRVPRRSAGDGVLPVPGWTGEHEWLGFLHPDEHPELTGPEEGFIVTGNNAILPQGTGPHIANMPAEPYRAMRIRQMLIPARDLTVEAVARQQLDVLDLHAVRHLPRAVRAAERARATEAQGLLQQWDGRATAESRAAALFYTWYEQLRRLVRRELLGADDLFLPRYALNRLLDLEPGLPPRAEAFARQRLEELGAVAMQTAVDTVRGRTWGEIHTTVARHALAESDMLDRALGLNVGPFPAPGSPYTVHFAGYGAAGPPFVNRDGPSMRFVTDLGDPEAAARIILPGGVSGIPFSRHYRDQLEAWRTGRPAPMRLRGARGTGEVMRLVP